MPRLPTIACFLADTNHPVLPDSPLWVQPLPADRHGATHDDFRYGDYFCAVSAFLRQDGCRRLAEVATEALQRPVRPQAIDHMDIFLEKHGACYHPSRVRIDCSGAPASLVVNAAVSAAGRAIIEGEYRCLRHLGRSADGGGFTPRVYVMDRIDMGGGRALPLFLGQWFDGFNEFHLSRVPAGGRVRMTVWDPVQGPFYLDPETTRRLYREAARILTTLYDMESTAQVRDWQHAAGDFVVRLDPDGRPALRLITVRNYASMMETADTGAQAMVEGLLLFVLDTTLRMRLDRLDGVGETVWADETALAGTLAGIFDALAAKERVGDLPERFAAGFFRYLADYPEPELHELVDRLVDGYSKGASDRTLARMHTPHHMAGIHRCVADGLENGEYR
ncbi:MAG: hypothetical protein JEZ11_06440 [Desulfobacterales bacterium]|nr:hypothetical protein [Desulfobacterales bacterium]